MYNNRQAQADTYVPPKPVIKKDGNMEIVPGDVIKPVTLEATSEERLMEVLTKRYRLEKISQKEWDNPDSWFNRFFNEALEIPHLKDALVFLVEKYTEHIGHDRDVILTEKELKEKRFYDDKAALLHCYFKSVEKGEDSKTSSIALQRMVTMRKLEVNFTYFFRDIESHAFHQGYAESVVVKPDRVEIVNGRNMRMPAVRAPRLTAKGQQFLKSLTAANTYAKKVTVADLFEIRSFMKA